jgi:hypothetical protein
MDETTLARAQARFPDLRDRIQETAHILEDAKEEARTSGHPAHPLAEASAWEVDRQVQAYEQALEELTRARAALGPV